MIAVLLDWRAGEGEPIEDASEVGWFTLREAEALDSFTDAMPLMRIALAVNPRPSGEGGAKRRVRGQAVKRPSLAPLTLPLSPEGRGIAACACAGRPLPSSASLTTRKEVILCLFVKARVASKCLNSQSF